MKPINKKPPKNKNEFRAQMENNKHEAIKQLIEQHKEEMVLLQKTHNKALSEVKKKQWCVICGNEAVYPCCWNTHYCSTVCQSIHWHNEHKKLCQRRKLS